MKVHTFEPNIRLIRLFSLILNYAKPRISLLITVYGSTKLLPILFGKKKINHITLSLHPSFDTIAIPHVFIIFKNHNDNLNCVTNKHDIKGHYF